MISGILHSSLQTIRFLRRIYAQGTLYHWEGALSSVVKEYKAVWGDSLPLIVADRNTWPIVGAHLHEQFIRFGYSGVEEFVFPDVDDVYADYEHVGVIRELIQGNGLIAVAVGSGTINDLVKLASYECGKSYMVVPTAPSVDGYTAIGAAITVDGFKRTLHCLPPEVMVADVNVLRDAPYDMIAAGYGDLAAKIPAGADWIIADRLGVERILPEAWDIPNATYVCVWPIPPLSPVGMVPPSTVCSLVLSKLVSRWRSLKTPVLPPGLSI